jgi:hypothetical protein
VLDWLVVGGGIHGTHLAVALRRGLDVPADRLRVLDPHPEPLALWERLTAATGMETLRSPFVHHLDLPPFALKGFAEARREEPHERLVGYYRHPTLALFRAHARHLVARDGLEALWVRGRACGLARTRAGWRVETASGGLEARRVILAIGPTETPAVPAWASGVAGVEHVFSPAFRRDETGPHEHVVVVGGGLSAAQLALALSGRPGPVTLVMRHPPRIHRFDSDPPWLAPPAMRRFLGLDPAGRRALITRERHRGSMPEEVALRLGWARERGLVRVVRGEAVGVAGRPGDLTMTLAGGQRIAAGRLVLATGFAGGRPGGAWLDRAIGEMGLPVAPCGFPVPTGALEWAPGLHVSGALAELEIGPVARNIAGAQRVSELLLARLAPCPAPAAVSPARRRGPGRAAGPAAGRPPGPSDGRCAGDARPKATGGAPGPGRSAGA